jgi:hypothetical protein
MLFGGLYYQPQVLIHSDARFEKLGPSFFKPFTSGDAGRISRRSGGAGARRCFSDRGIRRGRGTLASPSFD